MKNFYRCSALIFGAAATLLAGCGGSQPPIGAPGAMPQSRAGSTQLSSARSAGGLSADSHFVYVTNSNSGDVSAYVINPKSGALTDVKGSPFKAGVYPYGIAIDPAGSFAYVANTNGGNRYGTVSAYTINARSGALKQVNGSPFAAGSDSTQVGIDPTGGFAYVANTTGNGTSFSKDNVSAYVINSSNGALTPVSGSPFTVGTSPFGVAIDPTGKFAYFANSGSHNVSARAIDPNSGALTRVKGSPFKGNPGGTPWGVAINPTGRFAYVTDFSSGDVLGYVVNPRTGALTKVKGSPFGAGFSPSGVAIDPTGRFAYVTNSQSSDVSAYAINARSGVLTPVKGSPFSAGGNPLAVAIDPSGKFAYVANNSVDNVSAYSINARTGALTQVKGSPFKAHSGPAGIAIR